MKIHLLHTIIFLSFFSCKKETSIVANNTIINIEGTWKMVYASVFEKDSLKIKDITNTSFIKIINKSHFAFFNQEKNSATNFYGGGGTYTLQENKYVETLSYIALPSIRNHTFPFVIKIKGDTLIQTGLEEIKSAGIHREIVEKYIKIK